MQVFKAAVRIVLRHPVYLLVYTVLLSFMGIFIASNLEFGGAEESFSHYETTFSVIDRDGSDLARGLADFLSTQGENVPLEDTRIALQDAIAKGQNSYVLIIPEGYGNDLIQAARSGGEAPSLDVVYSYFSIEGSLMDTSVDEYVHLASAYAAFNPDASEATIVEHTGESMRASAPVETIATGTGAAESQRFVFYLQWGTYTLFASIVICVGILMATLNRTDLRRRNLTSPTTSLSLSLQTAAGCLFVMTIVWVWTIALGLTVFGNAVSQISPAGLTLMLSLSFVFATIPLACGYLFGQLGVSEFASNAIGNILGMAISFLGGAWVSYDLLDPAVQTAAHFSPAYWYTAALQEAVRATSFAPETLAPVLGNMGVMALFTIAIFAVALVTGRVRMQSAEAGGNAGAARK